MYTLYFCNLTSCIKSSADHVHVQVIQCYLTHILTADNVYTVHCCLCSCITDSLSTAHCISYNAIHVTSIPILSLCTTADPVYKLQCYWSHSQFLYMYILYKVLQTIQYVYTCYLSSCTVHMYININCRPCVQW